MADQTDPLDERQPTSQDRDGNRLVIEIHTPTCHAGFALVHGELLQWIDRTPDGTWDWDASSIADGRGACDVDRQVLAGPRATLIALTRQAHGRT